MGRMLASLFLILLASSVFAQTQPPAPPQSPQSCAPSDGSTKRGDNGEPLGDKLSSSKGVICPPPEHDPDIKVPPPDTGARMPVIKPPENAK